MKSQDCYIFWDNEGVPEANRLIHYQCVDCHEVNKKGHLWCARDGYGNFEIYCEFCKAEIHKASSS